MLSMSLGSGRACVVQFAMDLFAHSVLTSPLIAEIWNDHFRTFCLPGFCFNYFCKVVYHGQNISVGGWQRTHDICAYSFSRKSHGDDAVVWLLRIQAFKNCSRYLPSFLCSLGSDNHVAFEERFVLMNFGPRNSWRSKVFLGTATPYPLEGVPIILATSVPLLYWTRSSPLLWTYKRISRASRIVELCRYERSVCFFNDVS